jgi:hypothetical protein
VHTPDIYAMLTLLSPPYCDIYVIVCIYVQCIPLIIPSCKIFQVGMGLACLLGLGRYHASMQISVDNGLNVCHTIGFNHRIDSLNVL